MLAVYALMRTSWPANGIPQTMKIGDTLIFSALTIHKALPNLTEDRLRVSLDNRYQAVDDPIAEHMLEPHLNLFNSLTVGTCLSKIGSLMNCSIIGKNRDLTVIPRDFSYGNKGFEEALELARDGDERAILHLDRAIKRDDDDRISTTSSAAVLQEVNAGAAQ